MMTGMERLTAAINGTPADRIPVFCNLLDQGARELGLSIKEYYSRGEYVAEGQLRMREKYGYDNLWSLFYVGKEAELLGCKKIIFAENGPPNVGEMVIKQYEDIAKLQIPDDILTHPAFEEILKCLRILKAEADGKYPICAYLTASMTLPAILMGMENWIQLLLMGPVELRDELLAKCSDFFQKMITAYRNAGADVLIYSNPFGSTDLITQKIFDEVSLPWMEKDLRPGGPGAVDGVVYYCGSARFNNVIEDVIDKLGILVFYLSPMDDVAEGKKLIAGRGLTCGVINDIMLINWSTEQVRAEVKRIIDAGKTGGRFLFGTLVMPYEIPEVNIRAMLDAAFEYGRFETF